MSWVSDVRHDDVFGHMRGTMRGVRICCFIDRYETLRGCCFYIGRDIVLRSIHCTLLHFCPLPYFTEGHGVATSISSSQYSVGCKFQSLINC